MTIRRRTDPGKTNGTNTIVASHNVSRPRLVQEVAMAILSLEVVWICIFKNVVGEMDQAAPFFMNRRVNKRE